MPRARIKVSGIVSRDADQLKKIWDDNPVVDMYLTGMTEAEAHYVTLTAGQVDYAVPFGTIAAASLLIVIAEQDVNVKIGGTGNTAIPVKTNAADASANPLSTEAKYKQDGMMVLVRTNIASVHLTNPSGVATATALVILAGEAS